MKSNSFCSIVPYFKIQKGKIEEFKKLANKMVEQTATETACHYYEFTFNNDIAHCREGYTNADGVLTHLNNVNALLQEALKIANLIQLEIHGPKAELDKLNKPLADLNPEYFISQGGIRNF